MDSSDLGKLVNELPKDFIPLRCPCIEDNDEITSMLEQTFRMIMLDNNTLVSCCHETAMQWEVTEDTVQLTRCIIKPGNTSLITNLIPLEDGVHFFILQIDGPCSKISVHSTDVHTPLYELTVDSVILEVIPLSKHHFLSLHGQPALFGYSMRKPGFCAEIILSDYNYVCINKLPTVDNVIIVLYSHSFELWSITEQSSNILSRYDFKIIKLAVSMEVLDSSKVIVMYEDFGLQGEMLIRLRNLNVKSETVIPDKIEGEFVYPISSNCIITVKADTDRMGAHVEHFLCQSLTRNHSCKLAAGLYADERYSLFCFFFHPTSTIIVFTTHGKFYKCKVNEDLLDDIKYAELRKHARILSQAHRTSSSNFQSIPVEICWKIIAFTDESISEKKATSITARYFCKPHPSGN